MTLVDVLDRLAGPQGGQVVQSGTRADGGVNAVLRIPNVIDSLRVVREVFLPACSGLTTNILLGPRADVRIDTHLDHWNLRLPPEPGPLGDPEVVAYCERCANSDEWMEGLGVRNEHYDSVRDGWVPHRRPVQMKARRFRPGERVQVRTYKERRGPNGEYRGSEQGTADREYYYVTGYKRSMPGYRLLSIDPKTRKGRLSSSATIEKHCYVRRPGWVFRPEWRTDAVIGVARGIWEDRAWGGTVILADALQDAGCDDPQILWWLREGRHFFRGEWVLSYCALGHTTNDLHLATLAGAPGGGLDVLTAEG